jgi:uncharacterized protein (DUF2342 family)
MNVVAPELIPEARRFDRVLQERRRRMGLERLFQKLIGFDVKVRQYELGERFVTRAVQSAGMGRFNRVWERRENLPTLIEIGRPEAWVARVSAA